MSRQDTINAIGEAIKRQEELLRVQKKYQSRHGGAAHTVEHTEYVIRALKKHKKFWQNFKEQTREEWLRDVIAKIDRLIDSGSPRNVELREQYQKQLDALTG